MYKIGIIGDRESTLCFLPLGFSVLEATDEESARRALKQATASDAFAVLFIVEELAALIREDIDRFKDQPLPAITVIPGRRGSQGFGMASIRRAVERAVGADILK